MEEPTNVWSWPRWLESMAVVALLDAHETIAGERTHKLVREARDLRHRIQAKEYTS